MVQQRTCSGALVRIFRAEVLLHRAGQAARRGPQQLAESMVPHPFQRLPGDLPPPVLCAGVRKFHRVNVAPFLGAIGGRLFLRALRVEHAVLVIGLAALLAVP